MRRILAVAGLGVAALLVLAPASWAAESISGGRWDGSRLDAGPTTVTASSYRLSGQFAHQLNRKIQITVASAPGGSGACTIAPTTLPSAPTPRTFAATLTIPCNGTYTLSATAATTENSAFFPLETATLDRRVTVAAPAPTVTGITATSDDRTIVVTWDDMTDSAPDLSGYVVERKIDDGDYEELATLNEDEQSYTDDDLPPDGGEATYRVFATRPSPNGTKVSAASESAATTFEAAPPDTTSTTEGEGGSGTGGTDGSGTVGGAGAGSDEQAAPGGERAKSGGSAPRVSPPRVFSGTFLPPLLRPAAQTISTTTTVDDGFSEALPYEQGAEDAVLPKGAMASVSTDSPVRRGMAIPAATALVLAVWGFHLRMLARAARPTA